MSTVLDLVSRSLRILGVIATSEVPSGAAGADALATLNSILDQWACEGLMSYSSTSGVYSVSSVGSYTIGPSGATITAQRPIKIESAYWRGSDGIDNKLEIIPSAKYQEIAIKTTSSIPQYLWYNATSPSGTITLWPIPSEAGSLGITQRTQIAKYTAITDTVTLPPGYESALHYALAFEIASEHGKDPGLYERQMMDRKGAIKRANIEPILLGVDNALLGGHYNIYTDGAI